MRLPADTMRNYAMIMEPCDVSEVELGLVSLIQAGFPLSERPFALLAQKLGATEDEVIQHISGLKERGVVREIGPVIYPQALGYHSTLVAMKISLENLDEAQKHIWSHPGISHAYLRENEFNLWVTLALADTLEVESAVADVEKACRAKSAVSLPAVKIYKLAPLFGSTETQGALPSEEVRGRLPLEETEGRVVNAIQRDLPLVPTPFESMAKEAGVSSAAQLLTIVESLRMRGIIRRYGANINHRQLGYTANAIVCWRASNDQADSLGQRLASLPNVSHCYLRKAHPSWPYNIYAMIHARNREECLSTADCVYKAEGVSAFVPLFSTFEIKKKRNRYSA